MRSIEGTKGQRLPRCLPQSGASTSTLLGLRSLAYRRVDSERRIGGDVVQAALRTIARPVFHAANGRFDTREIGAALWLGLKAHALLRPLLSRLTNRKSR